jgi:hypothetical protein
LRGREGDHEAADLRFDEAALGIALVAEAAVQNNADKNTAGCQDGGFNCGTHGAELISGVLLGVGATATIAGAVLFATGQERERRARGHAWLVPTVSAHGAGAALHLSF